MKEHEMSEARLDEIRREAEQRGIVADRGIRPEGSPMPIPSVADGYYQQPLLKEPQWTPLIPLYFFVGGAAGSLGVIGALADLVADEPELARRARWISLAGVGVSSVLLVVDLGRPSRFINMLRVFKPQSVMSMGSWVLTGFGGSAAAASAADLIESRFGVGGFSTFLRWLGRAGCVLFGMPFHNYTGVLLGATVIPIWNNRIKTLPREFGMSGLQSAVSVLELTGETRNRALNAIGLVAAGVESWEGLQLLRCSDTALKPAKRGRSGLLVQLAGVLSGPVSIALRIASMFSRDGRRLRKLAALSGIAGSLLLRYGWVYAGAVSSRDWRIPLGLDQSQEADKGRQLSRKSGHGHESDSESASKRLGLTA